jgi:ABC-type multidrug transport system fused ATPase/permease subunit
MVELGSAVPAMGVDVALVHYHIGSLVQPQGVSGEHAEDGSENSYTVPFVNDPAAHAVEFDRVTFVHSTDGVQRGFGLHRPIILQDVSLSVRHGETVALVGRSGSGKTTFARLVMGYLRPTHGEVRRHVRCPREIAYIAQDTSILFDSTILQNVLYSFDEGTPAWRDGVRRVQAIVRTTGLWMLFDRQEIQNEPAENKEEGKKKEDEEVTAVFLKKKKKMSYRFLARRVGAMGERLSGGQRQIVYLLRCLVNEEARLIVLDEPTSSIDSKTRDVVIRLVLGLRASHRTVLIITHDEELARVCSSRIDFSLPLSMKPKIN